jgi:GNAT superfamily N-acetyltransferase
VSQPFLIRRAEPRDLAALESCFCALQAFEHSIEPNRADPRTIARDYIDNLLVDCKKLRGAVFVAESDGEFVGFAAVLVDFRSDDPIEQHQEHAYVTDLYVRDAARRSGVGSRLLQAAEAHALAAGASRLRVGVLARNDAAHALYLKLGYRDYEVILEKVLGTPE